MLEYGGDEEIAIAALLHATGGSANPFSVLYLVHIMLAAMMLGVAVQLARPLWSA